MNEHFDRHRSRLTDRERAEVWSRIRDGRRGGSLWTSWKLWSPVAAGAMAAIILAFVLVDKTPRYQPGQLAEQQKSEQWIPSTPAGRDLNVSPRMEEQARDGVPVESSASEPAASPVHRDVAESSPAPEDAAGSPAPPAASDAMDEAAVAPEHRTIVSQLGNMKGNMNEPLNLTFDGQPPAPNVPSPSEESRRDAGNKDRSTEASALADKPETRAVAPSTLQDRSGGQQVEAKVQQDAATTKSWGTVKSLQPGQAAPKEQPTGASLNRSQLVPDSETLRRLPSLGYLGGSGAHVAPPSPAPSATDVLGFATGGTSTPNDEPVDAMFFRDYGANPLVLADMDSLSTFATDVDKGAYSIMRRYVEDGHLPPRDAPRVEEFVNYFSGGYPEFYNPDFRILMDGAPSPFGDGFYLVRIGVKGRVIDESRRKPAHLVFVVDTSGSMQAENRLGLVRESLHVLLGRLRPDDRVGIVAYGSNAWVVLESTTVQDRRIIEDAIDSLQPSGSTNAEEGLLLGYRMARRYFDSAANNRILLCSDGVANVGRTGPDSILERVKSEADHGIDLTTVGFGMGNFNDVLMERLADQGDGAYYYVDDLAEAHRVFEENLTGTLQTIARDAKLQVEFDPKIVQAYRLLGFENRDIADPDFRNDAVDAGEIGAGHEVTALYEVRFQKDVQPGRSGRFATVRMRYEVPDVEIPRPTGWALANAGEKQSQTRTLMSQEPEQRDRSRSVDAGGTESGERAFRTVPLVQEIEQPLRLDQLATDVSRTTPRFRLAAVVAELAEILRQSYWAKGQTIDEILPMTRDVARELQDDPDVVELLRLVERARSLEATMSPSERVDRDRIADGQRPVPPYFPPGRDDE